MTPPPSKDQLREYYARKLAGMGESLDGLGGDAAPEPPAVEEKRKVGKVSFADPEGGDGGGAGGRSPRLARGNKPAMLSLGGAGKAPVSLSSNSNDESEFTSDGSVVSPVRAADLDSEHPDSGDAVKHLRRKLSPAITPLRIARNVHTPPGDSPTELLPPMKGLALKRGRKPPPLASSASEPILSTRNLQLHDDDAGYKSFDESDDEKSIATTYSESLSSLPPTTNYPRTGTIRRTPSSQLRRRKSMADKKLLIPLHGQPTFQPGTYDPAEIPLPNPLELNDTVLEVVRVLGYGNSGVVSLVRHIQTGQLYAKKVIPLQLDRPRFLRHMYRALSILALNKSPFLIGFVGCYLSQQPDPDTQFAEASICLEFMDLPNVQDAVPILRPTPCFLEFIRQATRAVLGAMEYLYEGFRAVHRDIKPANVLINSAGEIKLADLGELGTLGDEGYARTFVGTGGYMAVRCSRFIAWLGLFG